MDLLPFTERNRRVIGIWEDEKAKHQRTTLLYQENM